MELKRHYVRPPGWEPQYNIQDEDGTVPDPSKPEGALLNPLPRDTPVDYVELIHTGTHATQNLQHWIPLGVAEGWLTLSRGQVIIHTKRFPPGLSKRRHERDPERPAPVPEDVDLAFTVLRGPGVYCCHCGASLGIDASGRVGRIHVQREHTGVVSPDPSHPAGYRNTQAYECVLDEKQHALYNVQAREAAVVHRVRG